MKLALRLITLICYFLPCTFFMTTCSNGLDLKIAYNQRDADKNLELNSGSTEFSAVSVDSLPNYRQFPIDTLSQNMLKDTSRIQSETFSKFRDVIDRVLQKVVMPTTRSLSGIGSIFFFKNLTGKIAIATSLLISLILLLGFKFLRSVQTNLNLALSSVLSLTVFILDSFISDVTLLWGAWALLGLLILQMLFEFSNSMMKASR